MNRTGTKMSSISERRFGFIIFLLRSAGIPFKMRKISTIYAIYMTTLFFCGFATYIGLLLDGYIHWDDLERTMSSMRVFSPATNIMLLCTYCRLQQQSIERAVDVTESFTWEDLPTRDADSGQLTPAGWIQIIKTYTTRAAIVIMVFQTVQSSIRIATKHETLFIVWYPFDWTVSPFYELVNISQCFTSILGIGIVCGYLSLVTSLIAVACSQFDKLKAAIFDIRQLHITLQHGQEDEKVHTIANCELQAKLNACIRHHQEVLTFIQHLEDALNVSLCGHFLILLATMCFSAFSLVVSWRDYADMSQAVMVYLVYSSDVLLICWFGTQLTQHAESVRDAAFGCDWVGTPVTFQRCLMFIIAIANKEIHLTAGKFVQVSNVTMENFCRHWLYISLTLDITRTPESEVYSTFRQRLQIMHKTLSFFMFLLQVKDKKVETKQG